jgi:hypothetical protein
MSTPIIPLTLNRDALPISASVNDILIKYTSALAEIQRLLAEVERLRSDRDCEKRIRKDAEELREDAIARAEKSERAETVALANWNGALERAMKAEADLIALAQCHDDNCRGVVKIADDFSTEREKAERYRLATLKLDGELASERARLDWLQAQEVKRGLEITEGHDDPLPFLVLDEDGTTHWGDTYRAAIDAAMKEGAK